MEGVGTGSSWKQLDQEIMGGADGDDLWKEVGHWSLGQ